MRSVLLSALVLASACEVSAPPTRAPLQAPRPPAPSPTTSPSPPAVPAPLASTLPPASATPAATPPPKEEEEVVVTLSLEEPYKMEERIEPKTMDAWWAEFREHRMWNRGDMGELSGEPLGVEGHPDPRVIVNIDKVQGAHDADALERVARKYHWINVVRCYRLGAYKDSELRGWTNAVMTVSTAGRVLRPRLSKTELEDQEVAKCVVDKLRTLKFPRASKSTQAWIDIRVGPGDDPMPPPDDLIVPGEGQLPIEKMRAGVEPGLGAFEACYRAAFVYAPQLWGRVLMRFHLTEKGVLDEVFEAGSYFPDARVQQCILRAARKLKFARPKDGDIRFLVPLRLSSSRSVIGDPHARKPAPSPAHTHPH